VIQIRSVFNFAVEDGLIPHLPAYGVRNKPPSANALREHRLAKGDQSYSREDIIKLLAAADPNLRAWVLLGIQAGFSGADCRELPLKAFDSQSNWLVYPRAKTDTPRRVPLWPESCEALKACVEFRKNHTSEKLFISSRGNEYSQQSPGGWRVAALFKLLCKRAGVECKGFHSLRRTFQTQAEEGLDFVATKAIMGHRFDEKDMSGRYRQRISDARLLAVCEVVRQWLKPWEVSEQ
jgi:integrase